MLFARRQALLQKRLLSVSTGPRPGAAAPSQPIFHHLPPAGAARGARARRGPRGEARPRLGMPAAASAVPSRAPQRGAGRPRPRVPGAPRRGRGRERGCPGPERGSRSPGSGPSRPAAGPGCGGSAQGLGPAGLGPRPAAGNGRARPPERRNRPRVRPRAAPAAPRPGRAGPGFRRRVLGVRDAGSAAPAPNDSSSSLCSGRISSFVLDPFVFFFVCLCFSDFFF